MNVHWPLLASIFFTISAMCCSSISRRCTICCICRISTDPGVSTDAMGGMPGPRLAHVYPAVSRDRGFLYSDTPPGANVFGHISAPAVLLQQRLCNNTGPETKNPLVSKMSQEGLPEPCEFELVRPSAPAPSTPTQPLSASAPDAPIRLGSRKRVHFTDESGTDVLAELRTEADVLAELMAESRRLVSSLAILGARSTAKHDALVDELRRLTARVQVLESMVLPTPAAAAEE